MTNVSIFTVALVLAGLVIIEACSSKEILRTQVQRSFELKDSNKKLTNQDALVKSFAQMTAQYASIQTNLLKLRQLNNHVQGVAKRDGYLIFTSSQPMPGTPGGGSKVGADYGYIASGKIDKEGKLKEGGEHGIGNYFHPGGIQTIGDWVVVPVADSPSEKKSEIRFYKYKGGLCEEGRLRIHRKGNAGSVGITNYGKDGDERYLLATLPNHREIHFYWTQPGIPLSDQQCYFKGPKKWNLGTDASSKIKSIWKGYNNNCSLVADKEGSIYFIGLEAMQGDLYKVSIDVSKERGVPQLSHIKSFEFKLKGGPKFRWGASVLVTSSTDVELIATAYRPLNSGQLELVILD